MNTANMSAPQHTPGPWRVAPGEQFPNDRMPRADLVRRYRRALARANRYNGAVHWETVARLADQVAALPRMIVVSFSRRPGAV